MHDMIYGGRRVLVMGLTGFEGSWLYSDMGNDRLDYMITTIREFFGAGKL